MRYARRKIEEFGQKWINLKEPEEITEILIKSMSCNHCQTVSQMFCLQRLLNFVTPHLNAVCLVSSFVEQSVVAVYFTFLFLACQFHN